MVPGPFQSTFLFLNPSLSWSVPKFQGQGLFILDGIKDYTICYLPFLAAIAALYLGILWYIKVYYGILWYIMVYYGIL